MRDCQCGCGEWRWCLGTRDRRIVRDAGTPEERAVWVCHHCTLTGDHDLSDPEWCFTCPEDSNGHSHPCKLQEKYPGDDRSYLAPDDEEGAPR